MAFKSRHFPGQVVATRRGSPLVVGIKSDSTLNTNHFPVYFSKGKFLRFLNVLPHFLDAGWIWQDDQKFRMTPESEGSIHDEVPHGDHLSDTTSPRTGGLKFSEMIQIDFWKKLYRQRCVKKLILV